MGPVPPPLLIRKLYLISKYSILFSNLYNFSEIINYKLKKRLAPQNKVSLEHGMQALLYTARRMERKILMDKSHQNLAIVYKLDIDRQVGSANSGNHFL